MLSHNTPGDTKSDWFVTEVSQNGTITYLPYPNIPNEHTISLCHSVNNNTIAIKKGLEKNAPKSTVVLNAVFCVTIGPYFYAHLTTMQ